jgi:4-amino-4-deoxy-L-arabinose transferase-like glycosyltransferase
MLENTVTFFVLLSVWAQFKFTREPKNYWLLLAGLALVAGFLAKGPVALFPLAFLPLDRWLVAGKAFHKSLRPALIIGGVFALVLLLLLAFPGPREALSRYWDQQVWNSLNGIRRDGSRWGTALHLFQQLIPLLLLYIVGIWLNRSPEQRINLRYSLRWVLFALCGTLPIFISTKINIHYFIPAMPFYALALAPLFRDSMFAYLQEKFHLRRFRYTGRTLVMLCFAFTIILMFNQTGQPKRDQETIADLTLIAAELPEKAVVGLTDEIHDLWSLHANAYRFHHLSLAMDSQYPYVISTQPQLEGWQLLTPANERFFLHARDEAP